MSPHRSSSHVKSLTRVEAFVSDAVSDEITMQRYCFFLTWQWVVLDVVQSVSADL